MSNALTIAAQSINYDAVQFWATASMMVAALVAAVVWLRSKIAKDNHAEVVELADTRGERIKDLEDRQAVLERKIEELTAEITGLKQLKTDVIIEGVTAGVVAGLTPFFERT